VKVEASHAKSFDMTPPPSEFCATCAAIDFKALLYAVEDRNTDDSVIELGHVADILERESTCELCRMVGDALKERHKRGPSELHPESYCGFSIMTTREAPSQWMQDYLMGKLPSPWDPDEVGKYGIPVAWRGHPISCSIRTTFFCSRHVQSEPVEGATSDGEGEHGPTSRLVLSRLLLHLSSSSPWMEFSERGAIKFQAHWDPEVQNNEAAGEPWERFTFFGSGRDVGTLIDVSRVRGWLHQCEEQHGDFCAHPNWSGAAEASSPRSLRVVDITERRIVNMPPNSRYLALSYVWGENRQALDSRLDKSLTTRNFQQLEQVGGLDGVSLSNTVRDALALAADLGERYLWVDALCILQDDVDDLAVQTSQMDQVYSGAVFTIIAACGDGSHSGLAGTAQRPRNVFKRHVQVSGGMSLAPSAALSSGDLLPASTWNVRGWTFQERLLSRRQLVFTDAQVFWVCECATWDEETILEPNDSRAWVLPQALGCNDEWEDGFPRFSPEALSVYIAQYSSRDFAFQEDAHSAFLGVLRRYEHLNKTKTFWGLPTRRFDQHLLWKGGMERRSEIHRALVGGSNTCPVPYPSWSWLGWIGFTSGEIFNDSLAERTSAGASRSEIAFYSLMSDGTARQIDDTYKEPRRSDTARETSVEESPAAWKGKSTITGDIAAYHDHILSQNPPGGSETEQPVAASDLPPTASDLPVHDTGRLVFWTSHAKVKARVDDQLNSCVYIETEDGALKVNAQFTYEEILSLRSLQEEASNEEPEVLNNENSEEKSPQASEPDEIEGAKIPMHFIVISRVYEIRKSAETGKLNIMIVKESLTEPGLWSRVGLTVVEEKDWLRLERSWNLVVLG
jgi:hypothetical protein